MNDVSTVQFDNTPVTPHAGKSEKRMESGVDFSAILGKAAEKKSEAAVSERSRPERSERSERGERGDRSERPRKSEETKHAEESGAYANGPQQTTNNSDPVSEEKPSENTATVVISENSPDVIGKVIVTNEFIPEVSNETGEVFSNELQKMIPDLKAQAAQSTIQANNAPQGINPAIGQVIEELNGTVTVEQQTAVAAAASFVEEGQSIEDDFDVEGFDNEEVFASFASASANNDNDLKVSKAFVNQNVTITLPDGGGVISGKVVWVDSDDKGVYFLIDEGKEIPRKIYANELEDIKIKIEEAPKNNININNVVNTMAAEAATFTHGTGSVQEVLTQLIPNLQNMFMEVALSAQMTSPGTTSQLVLQLYPEHLGKLRIELTADMQGKISARIESGNAAVRALFQSGLADLIDCLRASGVDLKELEIAELEMTLTNADLGHRSNLQQDNRQNNQGRPYNGSRQQTITRIDLPGLLTGMLYDAAVMNSYIDENTSVEFTA